MYRALQVFKETSGGEAPIASVAIRVTLGSPVTKITKTPSPLNPIPDLPSVVIRQVDPLDLPDSGPSEPEEEKNSDVSATPCLVFKTESCLLWAKNEKNKSFIELIQKEMEGERKSRNKKKRYDEG